jgi:hypothetical protein
MRPPTGRLRARLRVLSCWTRGTHDWAYTVTLDRRAWFHYVLRRSGPDTSGPRRDAELEWCLSTRELSLYRAWIRLLPAGRWDAAFLWLRRANDDARVDVAQRAAKDRALLAEWDRRNPSWTRTRLNSRR